MQLLKFFERLLFPVWFRLCVNNPTVKGDSSVVWGAGSVVSTAVHAASPVTLGIITDAEKGSSADKIEIMDENGFVVTVVYFNNKNECSFGMIVKTSVPALDIGDTFTLGGVAFCIVDDIRVQWSNKDVAKYNVKATRYKALTADS